jgi:hypothetical protein
MGVQDPSPQTTLLVLLGASAWPFSPEFQRSQAFANAARRLNAYFLNPRRRCVWGLPVGFSPHTRVATSAGPAADEAVERAALDPSS